MARNLVEAGSEEALASITPEMIATSIPDAVREEAAPEEDDEAIRQRVNSLLNLDEEEMMPIVSELSSEQLQTLYRVASNQQREKLLRSLPPNRAARLMQEVLL